MTSETAYRGLNEYLNRTVKEENDVQCMHCSNSAFAYRKIKTTTEGHKEDLCAACLQNEIFCQVKEEIPLNDILKDFSDIICLIDLKEYISFVHQEYFHKAA